MDVDRKRTVVKLGGSFLDSPSWPDRLQTWFARQPIGDYFVIVGGGKLIDALRELDTCHRLSQSAMHWRCVRALDATFEIAAELTPAFGRILSSAQLLDRLETEFDGNMDRNPRIHWVRIASYYGQEFDSPKRDEPQLEHSWSTTTDSLALLLANRIHAERCVLLKSCDVKHLTSLRQAVDEGIVDPESIRFEALVPVIQFEQI
jgi:aspartokinase-like uncharacterized kinase